MLTITNLSKTYPNGVQALCNVTLNIPAGMFGLLGPNGAGKSTLMRTIATLQQPDEGAIDFDGLDVLREPDKLRKILGYLPQDFGVYPRISAEAMLDHMAVLKGIKGRGERKELVAELLIQTNLYAARHKNLTTYSGGMRQRFGIAQALIGDPRLLIVDEPTAGLDPEERNRFLNLLSEIGENKVVILSTHIVDDVSNLCPLMAIIAAGQIVVEGRPEDLVKELDGRMWAKTVAKDEVEAHYQSYNILSKHMVAGRTVLHAKAESNPGEGFEARRPLLEDVYFAALSRVRAAEKAAENQNQEAA